MNGYLTEAQKKQLFVAFVTFLLALAAVFGYDYQVVQPRERSLVGLESVSSDAELKQGIYSVSANPIRVKTAGISIVEGWNGNNIKLFSDGGSTSKFQVLGASGNTTLAGTLDIAGLATLSGGAMLTGTTTINGVLKGAAPEAYALYHTTVDATTTEISNTKKLVDVPAARQFQLVDAAAIAIGGACSAVTTVDLVVGSNKLVAFAQANLTQSTLLRAGATGGTLLADGASFAAQTAGDDLVVGKTGSTPATCTSIRFLIDYMLK